MNVPRVDSYDEPLHRLHDARRRTLQLVDDLRDDELQVPELEHVNPFLWELGHIAFFWEAFVLRELGDTEPLIEHGDELFDSFAVEHATRWHLQFPCRGDTLAYMARVAERVLTRLASQPPSARVDYLLQLAVLHEDMHGEAFTYMRQTLGLRAPAPYTGAEAPRPTGGPLPGDVAVPGGRFRLGAARDAPFAFDNEKWAHEVEVAPFRMARAPVTNAEFIAFVDDGGYARRELWSPGGWAWREREQRTAPVYWRRGAEGWSCRHFDALSPLAPHHPVVHVNWFEAEAWCRWAGRRLPSEAEWELAAAAEPGSGGGLAPAKRRYPWGDEPPTPARAHLDARLLGCVDVGAFAAGDSAFGCRQMLGNVWEWTASPFEPYPAFQSDTPYREYSAPWFGDRKVLRGGAWATRSRLACNSYRNFFPPHRADILAGFRTCAR